MDRRHNVKEIGLEIDEFEPFKNEKYSGFRICWSSAIGFGEYTVYKSADGDKWCGESECMDRGEDKEFISELMRLFIEQLTITD